MKHIIGIMLLYTAFIIIGGIAPEPTTYSATAAQAATKRRPVLIRVAVNWTPERIEQEIREVFPEEPETMIRIAKCESSLIADAKGPTNDHGIFQIHVPSHRNRLDGVNLDDPAENIAFARTLYDNGGLAHWRASKHCWQI